MTDTDFDIVEAYLDQLLRLVVGPEEAKDALARIRAENERLRLRDKMHDDGEHHLLGEIEARDKKIERLREALRDTFSVLDSVPGDVGEGFVPTSEQARLLRRARAALGEQP